MGQEQKAKPKPKPAPQDLTNPATQAAMLANLYDALGGGTTNKAVVPLWQIRPKYKPVVGGYSGNPLEGMTFDVAGSKDYAKHLVTVEAAKGAFLDLSDEEKQDFRARALQAGLVKPDDTDAALFNVWQQVVSDTAMYNTGKGPGKEDKYISPWEAIDKLQMQRAASEAKAFDGFSKGTQTSVQTFSDQQVAGTAESVLQQELGRNPTKGEIAAYTTAINRAAKANPVVTHTTTDQRDPAHPTSDSTTSGGIDPSQVILDEVRQDPEQAAYQASTLYYQAALNALNSIVSM